MSVDEDELGGFPPELSVLRRIVGHGSVGEVSDKSIHPAGGEVDLVDIFRLLDARGCQILYENPIKAFIPDRGQSGKSIRPSVFCPRDMGDVEPRK